MKKKISDSILRHYNGLFKRYGTNHKSLGWLKGKQNFRFEIVSQIGSFNNTSVLDVGCGFGDFYGFLKKKKFNGDYLGVDINPQFIEIAEKKFPKINFEVRDIQKNKLEKKFDWVVAIGITNHATTYPHIKKMIEEMFRISKKGIVIDFISNYVDFKDKEIFYTSPEIMFKFAKKLSKRVTLRHDYMPYEFCLYLYKDDKKTTKNIFKGYQNDKSKKI